MWLSRQHCILIQSAAMAAHPACCPVLWGMIPLILGYCCCGPRSNRTRFSGDPPRVLYAAGPICTAATTAVGRRRLSPPQVEAEGGGRSSGRALPPVLKVGELSDGGSSLSSARPSRPARSARYRRSARPRCRALAAVQAAAAALSRVFRRRHRGRALQHRVEPVHRARR